MGIKVTERPSPILDSKRPPDGLARRPLSCSRADGRGSGCYFAEAFSEAGGWGVLPPLRVEGGGSILSPIFLQVSWPRTICDKSQAHLCPSHLERGGQVCRRPETERRPQR